MAGDPGAGDSQGPGAWPTERRSVASWCFNFLWAVMGAAGHEDGHMGPIWLCISRQITLWTRGALHEFKFEFKFKFEFARRSGAHTPIHNPNPQFVLQLGAHRYGSWWACRCYLISCW